MRLASLDIETFCPDGLLSAKDLEYLKSRNKGKEEELILALNPYVSYIVSTSLCFLDSSSCDVFYISDTDTGQENLTLNLSTDDGNQEFTINFHPVVFDGSVQGISQAEKNLLECLWKSLENVDVLITYNGEGFDMPFLRIRTLLQKHMPTTFFRFFPGLDDDRRYSIKNHIDVMKFLSLGNYSGNYKLWFVSKAFGIYLSKDYIDGSLVEKFFLEGKYKDIAIYNAKDSIATGLLYNKLKIYENSVSDLLSSDLLSSEDDIVAILENMINSKLINAANASRIINWLQNKTQITDNQRNKIIQDSKRIENKDKVDLVRFIIKLIGPFYSKFNRQTYKHQKEEDEIT